MKKIFVLMVGLLSIISSPVCSENAAMSGKVNLWVKGNIPTVTHNVNNSDGFASQFTQNSNAVREAGCEVETHILEGYPHGYGTGGNARVWGNAFDAFLTKIMSGNASGINSAKAENKETAAIYSIDGKKVDEGSMLKGVFIKNGKKVIFN